LNRKFVSRSPEEATRRAAQPDESLVLTNQGYPAMALRFPDYLMRPSDNIAAHPVSAGSDNLSIRMNAPTLGDSRFASKRTHAISDDVHIPERIEIGSDPGLHGSR
jgi:hypothetical protein